MANEYNLDLSQNIPNALTAIADAERAKLIPRNDYNSVGNQYSSTNPDAIADGDSLGRGKPPVFALQTDCSHSH